MMKKYLEIANKLQDTFVVTPEIKRVWGEIDDCRVYNETDIKRDPPGNLFISGRPRSGKTQLGKHYAEKNKGYIYINSRGDERDIKPVAYVLLSHPFSTFGLYEDISKSLGAPLLPSSTKVKESQDRTFLLLDRMRVEMLIFDEIDFIDESRNVTPFEAMETLKYISERGKVALVCIGQPGCEEYRKMNLQYFSRFTPVKLNRFEECDKDFCEFLKELEEQIAPPTYIGLGDINTGFPQLIYEMSKGLVGLVSRILQGAFRSLGKQDENYNNNFDLELFADLLGQSFERIKGDIGKEEYEKIINGEMELKDFKGKSNKWNNPRNK